MRTTNTGGNPCMPSPTIRNTRAAQLLYYQHRNRVHKMYRVFEIVGKV